MKSYFLYLPLVAASLATSSYGSVLASWDTTDASGESPFYATTIAGRIASASITLGNVDSIPSGVISVFGFDAVRGTEFSDAVSFGDYFEVNIQAKPGLFLSLTSIDLNLTSPNAAVPGSNFFSDVAVVASTDGFLTPGNTTFVAGGSISNAGDQFFNEPIALSGGPFEGTENELDFRVYAWGNPSVADGASNLVLSNDLGDNALTISGASIPEISAALPLGVLLSFSIIGSRRRKRR